MKHMTFLRALLLLLALAALSACDSGSVTSPISSDGDTSESDTEASPDGDGQDTELADTESEADVLPEDGDGEEVAETEEAETEEAESELESENETQESDAEVVNVSGYPKPITLDTILDLAPALEGTQIHPVALADGESIWLAFDMADSHSAFDVFLGRLEGDGSWRTAPELVNTTDYNDLDPAIAINGDTLLLAWHSDNSFDETTEHDHNLDIYTRRYSRSDATAKTEKDEILPIVMEGSEFSVSAWEPQLVSVGEKGFVLSAAFAAPAMSVWQVFTAPIGTDGTVGEVTLPNKTATQSQQMPALAAAATGRLAVAYATTDSGDQSHLFYGARPDATSAYSAFVDPEPSKQTNAPALAFSKDGKTLYMAYFTQYANKMEARLLRQGQDGQTSTISFTTGTGADFSPALAIGDNGGVLLWYQSTGSYRADIYAQGFTDVGGVLASYGAPKKLNADPIAPYAPTLTYLGEGVYFTAWSVPVKNAARKASSYSYWLKGRFFKMTPGN